MRKVWVVESFIQGNWLRDYFFEGKAEAEAYRSKYPGGPLSRVVEYRRVEPKKKKRGKKL
jgi:hypothetical protein